MRLKYANQLFVRKFLFQCFVSKLDTRCNVSIITKNLSSILVSFEKFHSSPDSLEIFQISTNLIFRSQFFDSFIFHQSFQKLTNQRRICLLMLSPYIMHIEALFMHNFYFIFIQNFFAVQISETIYAVLSFCNHFQESRLIIISVSEIVCMFQFQTSNNSLVQIQVQEMALIFTWF